MKLPSPDNLPPSPLPHAGYEAGHKQSPLTRFIAYFAQMLCAKVHILTLSIRHPETRTIRQGL